MKVFLSVLSLAIVGCESTTQTAIRSNEVPAIAYVVAAQKGQPVPSAVVIRDSTPSAVIIREND